MRLSSTNAKQPARRHRQRAREGPHWFTADESALVEVLANLIVPSDETGPGVAELALVGRSAVEALDRLIAGSRPRQAVYARGLVALDRLAKNEYGAPFQELSPPRQVELLRFVDRVYRTWSGSTSVAAKIRTRITLLYHKWSGLFPAVALFHTLVQDVLQVFYTDPVSWDWLDYDGPPMPEGYANLLARRAAPHRRHGQTKRPLAR